MEQIISTKYDDVKIFAKTVENEAIAQVIKMANSPMGHDAHIRIMPDCHAGKGCTIGTTMRITNKVCPNLVGVDIGCGVYLVKTDIDFKNRLDELNDIIRKYIPYGDNVRSQYDDFPFEELYCWDKLPENIQHRAKLSMATLGGGNHFLEAYDNGWISVHSGSRNIGYAVAQYYQNLAEQRSSERMSMLKNELIMYIEPQKREQWLKEMKDQLKCDKELAFLMNEDMENYLHDVKIMQEFANKNRINMINKIVSKMNGAQITSIHSIHNYIDMFRMILRKGAISADEGEMLVIPLNMRDGLLLCKGKGNEDWNYSAPHGAGRLYSRAEAKSAFTVEEYAEAMKGIYSSCINQNTLDEAPFAYKSYEEIMDCVEPTVEIIDRLIPIFNFKADN